MSKISDLFPKRMINIVLIGSGKIGSRHLQALAKIGTEARIFVVDPNAESREMAYCRFQEIPENSHTKLLEFYGCISDLKTDIIDVAIIATTSEHRFSAVNALLNQVKVRYIILEKFLFQKLSEYQDVKDLLLKNNVKVWVNCPRRMWPVYQNMKLELADSKLREITIIGSDWSLATSSIHIVDLIAFITGCSNYELLNLDLGNKYMPAYSTVTGKRESKFIEFYGVIRGKFSNGTNFTLNCLKDVQIPFQIDLILDNKTIRIFEEFGKLVTMQVGNGGAIFILEESFSYPFQSSLTQIVVEDLISYGHCTLTDFDDSVALHLPLLNHFQAYLSAIKGKEIEYLPIT